MQRRQFTKWLVTLTAVTALTATSTTVHARPGRPASPNSIAGVRRRRRRRTRRRVYRNMRLTSLPYACSVTRVRAGVTYYYCSNVWYLPQYQGTTVVYVVHEIEPGANTDIEF